MHLSHLLHAASAVVLGSAALCQAATVYFQDVDGHSGFKFNGVNVVHAEFDDSSITTGGSASIVATNQGTGQSMQMRTTSTGIVDRGLIAIQDLFSLLPATNAQGQELEISSASLHLAAGGNYSGGFNIIIRRVKTNWLSRMAPGVDQNYVSGNQRNATTRTNTSGVSYTLTGGSPWAAGGQFGSSDWFTTNVLNTTYNPNAYGKYQALDITGMLQDMYADGINYGFQISSTSTTEYRVRASEDTLLTATFETFRPVLSVEYTYVPEPTVMSLAGVAAIALLGRRRRG